jgi:hypothetical protein
VSNPSKKTTPITINDYVLDASVTETHTYESEVTEYPVEQGSAITDNIRPKPIVVVVEGLVSDTPIGKMADLRNSQGGDPQGVMNFLPSTDALAAMIAIRDARQPVTIVTSLSRFESMAMTNLEIPRDASTGAALRFTASFQQVTIVSTLRVTVNLKRTATPGGKGKATLGKVATFLDLFGTRVITFPTTQRATQSRIFGQPLLTDTYGDHYDIRNSTTGATPDGFINPDDKLYHPFAKPATPVSSTTTVPATINGRPVHFDPGTRNADGTYTASGGNWVDDKNGKITQTVPPGQNKWSFVKSPFGGGV